MVCPTEFDKATWQPCLNRRQEHHRLHILLRCQEATHYRQDGQLELQFLALRRPVGLAEVRHLVGCRTFDRPPSASYLLVCHCLMACQSRTVVASGGGGDTAATAPSARSHGAMGIGEELVVEKRRMMGERRRWLARTGTACTT